MRTVRTLVLMSAVFAAGVVAGQFGRADVSAQSAKQKMVYELRTYYTHPGKLDALNARFRNHTLRLFEKHGMTNIGYWVPQDEPGRSNTLIYIVAHASREQATKNWDAFRADPEWQKVRAASEENGPIIERLDSVFMDAVDYSKLQ
jgi:hypothetical protein